MPTSDAERGPLSRLTAWGMAIPETLAAGIRLGQEALSEALATTLQPATEPGEAPVEGGGRQDGLLRELIGALRENTRAQRAGKAPMKDRTPAWSAAGASAPWMI